MLVPEITDRGFDFRNPDDMLGTFDTIERRHHAADRQDDPYPFQIGGTCELGTDLIPVPGGHFIRPGLPPFTEIDVPVYGGVGFGLDRLGQAHDAGIERATHDVIAMAPPAPVLGHLEVGSAVMFTENHLRELKDDRLHHRSPDHGRRRLQGLEFNALLQVQVVARLPG